MIDLHNVITRSVRSLQDSGTIVLSCSRQELATLLAQQVLNDLRPVQIVRQGKFTIGYNLNTDRIRTLAELVLGMGEGEDDWK